MNEAPSGLVQGNSRLHWMIGHPIAQVKMPGLANAEFRRRGSDEALVPIDVPPGSLGDVLRLYMAASNVHGLLCTLPYKLELRHRVHELSARAALLGCVNTVRKQGTRLVADLLDGVGFGAALRQAAREVRERRVGICGCGGFGRAAALESLEQGATAVHLLDTDQVRASATARALQARFGADRVAAADQLPSDIEILVNASPLGMRSSDAMPCRLSDFARLQGVVDAVTGVQTPLLQAALARGLWVIDGEAIASAQMSAVLDFWATRSADMKETI
jgi:shikimate dehydrogenase